MFGMCLTIEDVDYWSEVINISLSSCDI
jgi:hypothetical protein